MSRGAFDSHSSEHCSGPDDSIFAIEKRFQALYDRYFPKHTLKERSAGPIQYDTGSSHVAIRKWPTTASRSRIQRGSVLCEATVRVRENRSPLDPSNPVAVGIEHR